jgi:hypothetical protein
MVGLVVEALRHRRRHPRRLEEQEVDDPEVGHVLLALVELDAEGVGVGVAEVHPGPDLLGLAAERVGAVVRSDRVRRGGGRQRESGQKQCDADGRTRHQSSPGGSTSSLYLEGRFLKPKPATKLCLCPSSSATRPA